MFARAFRFTLCTFSFCWFHKGARVWLAVAKQSEKHSFKSHIHRNYTECYENPRHFQTIKSRKENLHGFNTSLSILVFKDKNEEYECTLVRSERIRKKTQCWGENNVMCGLVEGEVNECTYGPWFTHLLHNYYYRYVVESVDLAERSYYIHKNARVSPFFHSIRTRTRI